MKPNKKAKILINEYWDNLPQWVNMQDAKKCALIAVNELIESTLLGIDLDLYEGQYNENCKEYWEEVKAEIEKL